MLSSERAIRRVRLASFFNNRNMRLNEVDCGMYAIDMRFILIRV